MCFQFKILSVPYFMDECTEWELNDLVDLIPYADRNLWESSRLCAYLDAKSHFKGIHSYQDICNFKWEKDDGDEFEEIHNYEISNEEINRLKQLAKQWEKD